MRHREALWRALDFVRTKYPAYVCCHVELALEHDGEQRRSWSFGVHIDEEDPDFIPGDPGAVGYVHADGYVEGLYGANR